MALVADQRCREACRPGFEHGADFHVFVDLGRRQRGDDGAAIAQKGHQTLGLEVLERFANRDLADVEVAGDLVLPEQFAGRQQTIDNRLLERLRDMIRRTEARRLLSGDKFEKRWHVRVVNSEYRIRYIFQFATLQPDLALGKLRCSNRQPRVERSTPVEFGAHEPSPQQHAR
jgi:hypothetical protein